MDGRGYRSDGGGGCGGGPKKTKKKEKKKGKNMKLKNGGEKNIAEMCWGKRTTEPENQEKAAAARVRVTSKSGDSRHDQRESGTKNPSVGRAGGRSGR